MFDKCTRPRGVHGWSMSVRIAGNESSGNDASVREAHVPHAVGGGSRAASGRMRFGLRRITRFLPASRPDSEYLAANECDSDGDTAPSSGVVRARADETVYREYVAVAYGQEHEQHPSWRHDPNIVTAPAKPSHPRPSTSIRTLAQKIADATAQAEARALARAAAKARANQPANAAAAAADACAAAAAAAKADLTGTKRSRDASGEGAAPGARLVRRRTAAASAAGAAAASTLPTGLFCSVCNAVVPVATPMSAHQQSTVHQFNVQTSLSHRKVWLPDTNKGYQLLNKMGWDEAEQPGLGSSGQGRVQPIKTMLRPDKRGLGATMPQDVKYRVTHFPAHNEAAAQARGGTSAAKKAHDGTQVRAAAAAAAAARCGWPTDRVTRRVWCVQGPSLSKEERRAARRRKQRVRTPGCRDARGILTTDTPLLQEHAARERAQRAATWRLRAELSGDMPDDLLDTMQSIMATSASGRHSKSKRRWGR